MKIQWFDEKAVFVGANEESGAGALTQNIA